MHSIWYFWLHWQHINHSNCPQDTRNAYDNELSHSELGGKRFNYHLDVFVLFGVLSIGDPDDFAKFSCKFIVVVHISVTSSALTLTLLAVERYHAILKPFRSNSRLHEESIKREIFVIWCLSITIGFPGFFLEVSRKKSSCIGSSGSRNLFPHIFNVHCIHSHSGFPFLLWIPDKRIVFFRLDIGRKY